MSDVFISHSSKDKEIADSLVEYLEAKGISCWIAPRNIVPGSDWAASISTAITASKVFLLIYSENSARSEQCPKEVSLAEAEKGVTVVPYKIDDAELTGSYKYFLTGAHWISANVKKKDYKYDELYSFLAGVLGKNIQNISTNTYIDHLHIGSGENLPKDISDAIRGQKNISVNGDKNPAGNGNNSGSSASKSKLPIIIGSGAAAVALIVVIIIVVLSGKNNASTTDGNKPADNKVASNEPEDGNNKIAPSDVQNDVKATPEPSPTTVQDKAEATPEPSPTTAQDIAETTPEPSPTAVQNDAEPTPDITTNDIDYKMELLGVSGTGTYSGSRNDEGLPNGEGEFIGTFEDGSDKVGQITFTGNFLDGAAASGKAAKTFEDGSSFILEGTFLNGMLDGEGTETYDNPLGESYIKSIRKGIWESGYIRDGEFYEYYDMTDGSYFEHSGNYTNRKWNGYSVYSGRNLFESIWKFEGEWLDNNFTGDQNCTTWVLKSGEKIVTFGKFENSNCLEGITVTYNPDGSFAKAKTVGQSKYEIEFNCPLNFYGQSCTGFYMGELNEDRLPDGTGRFVGTYIYDNDKTGQIEFSGIFANGEAVEGRDFETFADGSTRELIGTFSNGKLNGEGIFILDNITNSSFTKYVRSGIWKDGNLDSGEAKETVFFSNKDFTEHKGSMTDGTWNGDSVYVAYFYKDGKKEILAGEYADGEFTGKNNTITWRDPLGSQHVTTGEFINQEWISGTRTHYDADGNVTEVETK